ncbi:isoquinoline 1-oxidoreductase subunit beta [Dokdonia pacifica]|uniref:Aldehyde oxidase/xanthine dehydrogenase a/b hammerhead domain-containing protein n=1 Tax=Dokdonia pacifica TaxID=1627892 RepID=A0A238YYY4_9FLAO|nr:molybdopterin cofactor-binding domain-containing protein [Dokdonia pacifica]GGG09543.1 isoquinoline 1-oxidoreductase subunit beta [Dokdonia pacifica]SNR75739.1 hypothetical protein/isoquinoline 1-oxidoreductase, beta subunit [Dokdonia pacifica]
MSTTKTTLGRRSFLKNVSLAGGGLVIGFSWLASCKEAPEAKAMGIEMPKEWFELNGFLKIGDNGIVTIMSPNPEIGQNVKTSMPMLVAEELDIDWANVIVEQAPLNTDIFTRQVAGGSQSIRASWEPMRKAGATARQMLKQAAADTWEVPVSEIKTKEGVLIHEASGKKASYGEMASKAATLEVPEEVVLKEKANFSIIGTSKKNVDGKKIVTGQPLYGIDTQREGMKIAMIVQPPAFGMQLKSIDDTEAKKMPGITNVLVIDAYVDDQKIGFFDQAAFPKMAVVVGDTTWQVMQAKKALNVTWEMAPEYAKEISAFGRTFNVKRPVGLENTNDHIKAMQQVNSQKITLARKDGNPEKAFKNADRVIERSYSCPFLAHNTMEPMNFFANVTNDKAELMGPIQTPEAMEHSISERLDMPLENIDIKMTRMGGGFGRRLYGHFLVEAAVISKEIGAPVKLQYSREDDMTNGVYRPAYYATYKAALDVNNNLIGFHVIAGGIPESPLAANRFPAGAIDNYLAETWSIDSNITTGAFRAPRSNFIAGAEQSFLDELAEEMGKDPFDLRLELLEKAKNNPVGENNDYDAARYAGVLELVRKTSNWDSDTSKNRGVSAYFCHNSYVAQVLDLEIENNQPKIKDVYCAVDCGIVVNPDAATNLVEGGIVDGIGHAMYSSLTFKDGKPDQKNFDTYRLIRHNEAPENIKVDFVQSDTDPTGLGEPPFPPIMGAVANALYKATGTRHYHQPFMGSQEFKG